MEISSLVKKIALISALVFVIIFAGSLGYYFLEDYSWLDAVYMTAITLTTTGFGEVVPLTSKGKMFTIVLLLMGVGVVTYSISQMVSYVASIDFSQRRRKKMEKKIMKMKNHTIVCGYGNMGEIICKKLKEEGVKFVVVEKRETLIQMLEKAGYDFIEGDAAHDEILEKAGVREAKVLVSVIDSDADGLYITLAGRSFNPNLLIIARASEPSAKPRMIRASADKVILPFVMSGLKVAESVINPAVEDFLNLDKGEVTTDNTMIQLADLFVTKDSSIVGKSLKEVGPKVSSLIIVGVRKSDHSFQFNPRGDYVFEVGDCLIAMGKQASYKETKELFNLSTETPYKKNLQTSA